ncbi:MAG: 4-hydroxy-tetrahydrodipicolinate reductase [Bacillota bacterium]|nr:4-hydroxy-tetrahydrodipicolinate reductase [Bacillota bacterium]
MIRILLNGANGRMGQVVAALAKESDLYEVVAGADTYNGLNNSFKVYPSLDECTEKADVIIDFSNSQGLEGILSYAQKKKLPVVIATTGHTKEQLKLMQTVSENIPIFISSNMSIGVNLLIDLVKKATVVLGDAYDIEIIEKHHNNKLDAPSGTALSIAEAISGMKQSPMEYTYDRHNVRKKRDKKEIGISSVRGGTIVGEHEVIFAGPDEVIEIKHHAASRQIFAEGALRAAVFLAGKKKGMYSMKDIIN